MKPFNKMYEKINELIEANLKLLFEKKNHHIFTTDLVDENGKRLQYSSDRIETMRLARYMESKGLIEIFVERCELTEFGYNVSKSGGWLKHLKDQEEKQNEIFDSTIIGIRGVTNNNIFIVHGHDTAMKEMVARTISKLDLNPIILHEQPNAGRTIIEKFEANANVGFAVVLLTDDDLGKAKSDPDHKKRARQNVVLELGFFFGRLGRSKVVPLYAEGVELPSDLDGLGYVKIDSAGKWKIDLALELKHAGYDIDLNKLV